jgi:hypothetical protein
MKKRHFFCIFKSKPKTVDFLTNQGNTDTGIRLRIDTIQTNTKYMSCLCFSVAVLMQPAGHNNSSFSNLLIIKSNDCQQLAFGLKVKNISNQQQILSIFVQKTEKVTNFQN